MKAIRWTGVAVLVTAACSGSPLQPSDVAGTYRATTYNIALNTLGTVDYLAAGASITLELKPDGTIGGHVTVPEIPGVSRRPVDEAFAGSFKLRNEVLSLATQSDSAYLSGALFTVHLPELRNYLSINDGNRSGLQTLILTRQ